jgi:hypothetical protein
MKIRVKKQFVTHDIFEYSDEGLKDTADVIADFAEFPWTQQLDLSKKTIEAHAQPSIYLSDERKQKLSIYTNDGIGFTVSYSRGFLISRSIYADTFSIDEVKKIIELFGNSGKKSIEELFKLKSFQSNLWLIDLLNNLPTKQINFNPSKVDKDFTYSISANSVFRKLFYTIVYLLLPTVVMLLADKSIGSIPFWIFQSLMTLLALPGLILTVNHYLKKGDEKLLFKKNVDVFFLLTKTSRIAIDKKDLKSVLTIETKSDKAPWSSFGYFVLTDNKGKKYYVSNLQMHLDDVSDRFGRLAADYEKVFFPIIRE